MGVHAHIRQRNIYTYYSGAERMAIFPGQGVYRGEVHRTVTITHEYMIDICLNRTNTISPLSNSDTSRKTRLQ